MPRRQLLKIPMPNYYTSTYAAVESARTRTASDLTSARVPARKTLRKCLEIIPRADISSSKLSQSVLSNLVDWISSSV